MRQTPTMLYSTKKGKKLFARQKYLHQQQWTRLPTAGRTHSHLWTSSQQSPTMAMRSFKLLGILLDENLTLNEHINSLSLSTKIYRATFMLNKAKHFLSTKAPLTLHHALFQSHIAYCPPITSIASQAQITRLHKQQNKAIRIITQSAYNAHTEPLFKKHKILTIHQLIT